MSTTTTSASVHRDGQYRAIWPRLPWCAFGGRYRLPMRDVDLETAATRLEDLWILNDLPDADRRLLLKAARDLEHLNCGYAPASGEDIFFVCALLGELEGRHHAPN